MTPEIIILTATCTVLLILAVWLIARTTGNSFMANTVAKLREENSALRERVATLETEHAHDRITIEAVLAENQRLRCEMDVLKQQLAALDKLVEVNRHDADEARATAERLRRS